MRRERGGRYEERERALSRREHSARERRSQAAFLQRFRELLVRLPSLRFPPVDSDSGSTRLDSTEKGDGSKEAEGPLESNVQPSRTQ